MPCLQPGRVLGKRGRPNLSVPKLRSTKAGAGAIPLSAEPARCGSRNRALLRAALRGQERESITLVGGRWLCGWQGTSRRTSPSTAEVSGAAGPRGREGRAGLGPSPWGWGARPPPSLPTSQPRCREASSLISSPQRDQTLILINAKPAQTALGEEWEAPAPAVARLLCAWGPAEPRGHCSQLLR